jgi:hypothetical protein
VKSPIVSIRRAQGTELATNVAMLHLLAALTLLLSAADHWTTYLCLRSPVSGFDVTEANPFAAWLFQSVGLTEGLIIDSLLTVAALAFLLTTRWMPRAAKVAFLIAVIGWTGFAVANNLNALYLLGLSPIGAG